MNKAQDAYLDSTSKPFEDVARIGGADIVVGIPFYNEADTIGHVVDVVKEGLTAYYPNKRCVICCAGSPSGDKALKILKEIPLPSGLNHITFLMKSPIVSGKGWALRAIMEVALKLSSDLVILEADLLSKAGEDGIEGLSPDWLNLLLEPIIKEGVDLVLSRFNRHFLDLPISNHLFRPLIASVYNLEVRDPLGGEFGISSEFLKKYLEDPNVWTREAGSYGVDIWLILKAIIQGANIAEAPLGVKLHRSSPGKQEMVSREQIKVLFEEIFLSRDYWTKKGKTLSGLLSFGPKEAKRPEEVKINLSAPLVRYRQGFSRFHALYHKILPEGALREAERLAECKPEEFELSSKLWGSIVYEFLLTFCFDRRFTKGDILNGFIPLYEGRVASFAKMLKDLEKGLEDIDPERQEKLLFLEAESEISEEINEFVKQKPAFLSRWKEKEETVKPFLPRVTYREFIPGVPLVLPHELTSQKGETVKTDDIYRAILERYRGEFEEFVHKRLNLPKETTSLEIAEGLRVFMGQVERELGETLLQGDLNSVEGTKEVVRVIFETFPHRDTFALSPEVASYILRQFPPTNLLIKFSKGSVIDLEGEYDPNDILSLSSLSEEIEYTESIWDWILENVRAEHFCYLTLKPLVVDYKVFPSVCEMKEVSSLSKLSGRVVIANLRKGIGGEFPKLRYFTMIAKNIVEAERFGEVWEEFALKKKEFGRKVINSLKGHWGREALSAHNIFENKNQRVLIQRLKEMTKDFGKRKDFLSLSSLFLDVASSYHLAQTLPDGKFIPGSAWTWASYSFKGGKGFPTPFSLHVERDWASREFLLELYKALGGGEKMLDEKIVELMGQGREWENLADVLLPQVKEAEEVSPDRVIEIGEPKALELHRFEGNPILEPIKGHKWESKYVFNAGAIRLRDKIYILYRAMGEDEISRIGLAISSDGFHIEERLEAPIFEPKEEWEQKGCEDPRLTLLGERVYMLYTAYSSIAAQIALASTGIKDFLEFHFEKWKRHGLLFPGFSDKDAILFPEKFDGGYAMYHRIEPSIWISFSENLDLPWPRKDHRILIGPRAGMIWDGVKVGAGTQPIKTKYGWLLIYHGMDLAHTYRLGVLLVALEDPGKIIYRSPNFVLEPKEWYEVGEEGIGWIKNVVFTCGAVPIANKEILEDDDEILVYYGAADATLALATARVSNLIPKERRVGEKGLKIWHF